MLARAAAGIEGAVLRLVDWAAPSLWRRALLTLAVALAVTLPGTTTLPVTDRDEARFAQATKQMMESGDYVDIRFQDRPRWKKPAGIYWLQAGAATAFGGVEAPIGAYRIPSILGVILAAFGTAWAASRLFGAHVAVLAGPMMAATILAAAEATIAKTDAMLLGMAALALGALAWAHRARIAGDRAPQGWSVPLLFWVAVSAAILLKGPILPAILGLALLGLWLWRRERPPLAALKPLPGLALTLLLCAPWLVAIFLVSEGRFFAESVGRDLLGKVAEGQEKHWGPPGLYTLLVWITFWPWAAALPMALPWIWRERRSVRMALLIAWVVPFWLVLEAVPTKLPHYVLPLYPALAIAVAAWALSSPPEPRPWQRRAAAVLVALPPALLVLGLLALPWVLGTGLLVDALVLALAGLLAALVGAGAALAHRPPALLGAGLLSAVAVYPAILTETLPRLETVFPSERIAEMAAPWQPCASAPLLSAGYREPSLVFHAGTGTRLATPQEAARALETEAEALVFIEDRWWPLLDRFFADGRPEVIERGRIRYFNYNRGDFEDAALVTTPSLHWAPCEAALAEGRPPPDPPAHAPADPPADASAPGRP